MKQRHLVWVGFMALLLVAPAVVFSGSKQGGEIIIGLNSDFVQLDPHRSAVAIEGNAYSLMCETLVAGDNELNIQPMLAESWDVSEDGLQWVFHIRRGVLFHNGREFTAQDVKWNFDRVMKPETASKIRPRLEVVELCDVLDRYKVRFTLKSPSASFLNALWNPYSLTFYMIAEECVDDDGKISKPIGTGPFQFKEWKSNDHATFVRFDQYWNEGLPYLEKVVIKPISDEIVLMSALKSGAVDLARGIKLDEAASLMKNPDRIKGLSFEVTPHLGATNIMLINLSKPPLDNVAVRRAILYGLDKEEIALVSAFGYSEATNQMFTRQSGWWVDVPKTKRDVKKAREILKEAGYSRGLQIELLTATAYPEWVEAATVAQDQLREIGIDLKIDITDWPTQVRKSISGDFQMQLAHIALYNDPEHIYRSYLYPDSSFFFLTGNAYRNPRVKTLIDEAAVILDQEERKKRYKELTEIYNDEIPWLPLYVMPLAYGWRDHVKGFVPSQAMFHWHSGGIAHTWLEK